MSRSDRSLPDGKQHDQRLLDVQGLRVGFRSVTGVVEPVRGVSLRIKRGQRLALVGESGSGKSLTALALMRLIRSPMMITGGSVALGGQDLLAMTPRELARVRLEEIAMVYQDPLSALNPLQTVGHQIAEAIRLHRRISRREAHEQAVDLLTEVGVPNAALRSRSFPHEFSGGMRQRVVIAMAICLGPKLLIADEPTTALDVTTQARIVELLRRLVLERNMAVILITHDLGLAATFCTDVAVMYAGRIVDQAPADEFYRRPVHPYSEALLESVPRLGSDPGRPLPAIGGQPPTPGNLPHGCSFCTRCPYALEVCRELAPPEFRYGDSSAAECHRAEERVVNLAGAVSS